MCPVGAITDSVVMCPVGAITDSVVMCPVGAITDSVVMCPVGAITDSVVMCPVGAITDSVVMCPVGAITDSVVMCPVGAITDSVVMCPVGAITDSVVMGPVGAITDSVVMGPVGAITDSVVMGPVGAITDSVVMCPVGAITDSVVMCPVGAITDSVVMCPVGAITDSVVMCPVGAITDSVVMCPVGAITDSVVMCPVGAITDSVVMCPVGAITDSVVMCPVGAITDSVVMCPVGAITDSVVMCPVGAITDSVVMCPVGAITDSVVMCPVGAITDSVVMCPVGAITDSVVMCPVGAITDSVVMCPVGAITDSVVMCPVGAITDSVVMCPVGAITDSVVMCPVGAITDSVVMCPVGAITDSVVMCPVGAITDSVVMCPVGAITDSVVMCPVGAITDSVVMCPVGAITDSVVMCPVGAITDSVVMCPVGAITDSVVMCPVGAITDSVVMCPVGAITDSVVMCPVGAITDSVVMCPVGAITDSVARLVCVALTLTLPCVFSLCVGHTTPNSMDDEDFTDGHDSMSQVSTSEQSENEDIRAFENYVQEFNRKKDAQGTGDSLVLGTGSQGRKGEKSGRGAGGKGVGGPTAVAKTPPAVHFPIPGPPGPATHAPTVTAALKTDEEDFADFKSARDVGGGGSGKGGELGRAESSGDMVLLGEEDRYSALRSVTAAVPSLFEKRGDEDDPPSPRAQTSQDQSGEWADFSSAADTPPRPPIDVAQLAVSQPQSVSGDGLSSAPAGGPGVGGDADDWADFAAAKSVTPSGGGGVGGEGAKASSSADNISLAGSTSRSGPSSGFPAASDLRDPPTGVSLTGSGGAGWGESAGEDWADFATAKQPTADADQPHRQGNPPTDGGKGAPGLNPANTFTVIATDSSDRGPYSSAQSSSSEVFTGAEQSAVLTVKKRNLETSEIMGVFKLRDDPTTMSSYELPRPQPPPHRPQAYPPRRSRSHSGGQGHEMSPDGDDFGTVPPPLDSVGDEEDEEFSRGYDLDDMVHPPAPTTVYNPFGFAHPGAGYSRSAFTAVTKTSSAGKDRPSLTTTTLTTDGRPHSLSPESGDTDSLSNRVSSLREDSQSVSSLDLPASKMSSSADAQRDSDNGGTDSQSVSSMEFGAGGDGGGGGVREGGEVGVCESKSLDSLDLRSVGVGGAGGEEEGEEEENDRVKAKLAVSLTGWGGSRYGGNQPPAPGAPPTVMDPTPILADRYNLDGQQVEGSERYAFEWERCLASSCRHISGANNIFNTISSSGVCNEVLRSPQGSDYVLGLIEIYRVVCRIMTSLPTAAVTSASIEQSLKQIDLDWNNLTAFLVGASLLPDEMMFTFKQAVLKLDAPAAQLKACGVCLLDVDYRNTTPITPIPTTPNIDVLPKLSYGGRQYHAPCANFWVNCVDSMLPALKLPELL
ncbi:hypothetical protein ACOMHN_031821 [Nucella lapillus]